VALVVVVGAIAQWKLKVLLALIFAAITISAAMPIRYVAILGLLAIFLSFVVPDMINQVQGFTEHHRPHTGSGALDRGLNRLENRLRTLPTGRGLVHPAVSYGTKAIEALVGIFFVLLSVPIASLVVTIIDVTARGIDPAEAEVATVLFPAGDAET
jgi:hypothetical protein